MLLARPSRLFWIPRTLSLMALALFTLSFLHASQDPLAIGTTKQLFLGPWGEDGRDTYLLDSMTNVAITMNEAQVTGERLMDLDRPWEGKGILDMRQFVLKDGEGGFRIYYSALPYQRFPKDRDPATERKFWTAPHQRILCFAESRDGIHWEKPNLGLYSWEGSRENNILFPNDDFPYLFSEMEGASVFIDPNAASADEKHKMLVKISPIRRDPSAPEGDDPAKAAPMLQKGQYSFISSDGIHWKLVSPKKLPVKHNDTHFSVFWDKRINKYVAYTRRRRESPEQISYYRKRYGFDGRTSVLTVGRIVSDDFRSWSEEDAYYWDSPQFHPVVTISPDTLDQVGSPPGLNRMDFYGGNVSKYSEAPDAYIALPNAYYHWKFDMSRRTWQGRPVQLPSTLDVQLMTSRDGIRWNRSPRRRPFIRLGRKGTFWSSTLWPNNVITVGDEIWIFLAGLDVSHKEQSLLESHGARTRAVLRLDGFFSADAAYGGGELTTRSLIFTGDRLQLNLDTSAGGVVRVEIQGPEGEALPGFAAEDADEINGNYIRVSASWKGSTGVGSLAGRPVRLRFLMRDARLYSFQFLPGESSP